MDPDGAVPGACEGTRARARVWLHRRPRPRGRRVIGSGYLMSYQLAALRLRSIGERAARFIDLTIDLTAPTTEGPSTQDSVVWLRNGGGKSSILSLLYAQLLPHANDFMGRAV